MANVEFGTGKTLIILSIVAACFAVLWPKVLYPMFTGNPSRKADYDNSDGCCDVMFETDINAIKIMNDLCGSILNRQADFNPKLSQAFQQGKLSKEVINTCRTEVMNMCGIDIAEFLNKKEKLGHTYKQLLDEIRSFNISICLRHHFGVNPGLLGAPRRMRIWSLTTPRHLRQERPLHFRQEIVHPALRERGRAIPQGHAVPQVSIEKQQEGRITRSGRRPPLGSLGKVESPPKVGGTMGIVMPAYTIGIILFFTYTVLKILSRKLAGGSEYKNFQSDPEFRRVVFSEDYSNGCAARIGEDGMRSGGKQETSGIGKSPTGDSTRLGDIEIDHLKKRLEETEKAMERIVAQMETVPKELLTKTQKTLRSSPFKVKKNLEEFCSEEVSRVKKTSELTKQVHLNKSEVKNGHLGAYYNVSEEAEDSKPKVKVLGLELVAECEGGQKWSRPATPNLGVGGNSRPTTPIPPPYSPEPQNIFLEGSLPQQSQLLVTDSKTQTLTLSDADEPEPPVILSSKMTLSLISLDAPISEDNCSEKKNEQALSQSHTDIKSEFDDNLGTADSTLLDIDSELIDENVQNEFESMGELEEIVPRSSFTQHVNEILEEKPSLNYNTATSERAEDILELESEDTGADVSNLDGLDITEDQEYVQNENVQLCNGNSKEANAPNECESIESRDSQQS